MGLVCFMIACFLLCLFCNSADVNSTSIGRSRYQFGCQLDNVEIKVSSRYSEAPMLAATLRSLKLTLPCFVRVSLVVSVGSEGKWFSWIQQETSFLSDEDRKLIVIVEEKLEPVFVSHFAKFKKQDKSFFLQNYFDLTADKLVLPSTEYVMVVDADTAAVLPFTCQSLFDENGLPYWTYWLRGAPWARDMSAITNDPKVLTFLNATSAHLFAPLEDFMTFFPMVIPVRSLQIVRKALMVHFNKQTETEAFLALLNANVMYSNFDLLGKIMSRINNPSVVSVRRCDRTSNVSVIFGLPRSCDTGYYVVEHVAHPSQSAIYANAHAKHIVKMSPEYWKYSQLLFNQTVCFCWSFPGLCANDTGLLSGAEAMCKSRPSVAIPEQMMFYKDNESTKREELRTRLAQFAANKQDSRKLCSDPYPGQVNDYLKTIWF